MLTWSNSMNGRSGDAGCAPALRAIAANAESAVTKVRRSMRAIVDGALYHHPSKVRAIWSGRPAAARVPCLSLPHCPPVVVSVHRRCLGLDAGTAGDADAETPSITRLEGSRWRG